MHLVADLGPDRGTRLQDTAIAEQDTLARLQDTVSLLQDTVSLVQDSNPSPPLSCSGAWCRASSLPSRSTIQRMGFVSRTRSTKRIACGWESTNSMSQSMALRKSSALWSIIYNTRILKSALMMTI
jgi:hypothetical protein